MQAAAAKGGRVPSPEATLHTITPLAYADTMAVERLLDEAFGSDRHGRTAYRLREGVRPIAALSFAAFDAFGALHASLQCWPVQITSRAAATTTPLVLVGPVAVARALQRHGLGRRLMERMLAAWDGQDALMLIGDPEYYGRFFGFAAEGTGAWELPGPVERRRLLARAGSAPLPGGGRIGPRG